MSAQLLLSDLQLAWQARDPKFVDLFCQLAVQAEQDPEPPIPTDAFTFERYSRHIRSGAFAALTEAEQVDYRQRAAETFAKDEPENYLTDRLRSFQLLLDLWQSDDPLAREFLLEIIHKVPLRYGPWKAIKLIYKEAEAADDSEMIGALVARFDSANADWNFSANSDWGHVRKRTVAYMARRGWRYLRQRAISMPVAYADCAVDVLAHYEDNTRWSSTWVANHIFYHETGSYGANSFTFSSRPSTLLKYRAFADLWRRSPRPLFALLERARSEQVRRFAIGALKQDFRTALRDVEPHWVSRLSAVGSANVDDFIVWILDNVPRFEQAALRELGLHDTVLSLFNSPSDNARDFAARYARVHARDLALAELLQLAANSHKAVQGLALDLLAERDPRKDIGLDVWGQLLAIPAGYKLAAKSLLAHFTAKELDPAWFEARLSSDEQAVFRFAAENLLQVHKRTKLGAEYFINLMLGKQKQVAPDWRLTHFALEQLPSFDLNELDVEDLQLLLIQPQCTDTLVGWIEEDRLKASLLPLDYYKALAFEADWQASPWVQQHISAQTCSWLEGLNFSESLSSTVLNWLADVRRFKSEELGFDWLMQLVNRPEPRYHDFASSVMIKAFLPGDFAEPEEGEAEETVDTGDDEINIDLQGAKILFTGKLSTMTRSEAQAKLRTANGAVASAVNGALSYLVIGDEGSPLYGEGRKGSKQVKAEKLIADGADLKIISETAFLKMLAGEQREVDSDTTQAGCERLWALATEGDSVDTPIGKFALEYLRMHHTEICPAETDRYVDPGAEIPAEFLTFEQVRPLYLSPNSTLRSFALELAHYEFKRWNVPVEGLVALAAAPDAEVRDFLRLALLADDSEEHRAYRIDTSVLTVDAVYRFCESADAPTRELGMQLIGREARLQLPEELFRLTESPDRQMRAFVIQALWRLYRQRGVTADWKPRAKAVATMGKKAKQAKAQEAENLGEGSLAVPAKPPAALSQLSELLRRLLFELPPARPAPNKQGAEQNKAERLKPLPARKAKLALIESLRDMAERDVKTGDEAFSQAVLPILREFMGSRGEAERAACFVAVTRIEHLQSIANNQAA